MKVKEVENKDLQIKKINMLCDQVIQDNKGRTVAKPLMNTSSFVIISGASGSGKTNLLISLLKSNKLTKDKSAKLSYRNCFDKILFVSPSSGTIKDNPLEKIADDQKFEEINEDMFDMLDDISEDAVEDEKFNLLILDDVSSQLRLRENEHRLNQIIKNRRHKNLTVWCVTHKVTDLSPKLRCNASQIYLFKPKTNKEIQSIQEEYMLMPKKDADLVMGAAFQTRYDFMMIDASLRESPDFQFYRNFNLLVFEGDEE
jgi:ABC-type transport system involved in cytochrome bd biosynthesis fused ATPase/permease subunit